VNGEVAACLHERDIAPCQSDAAGWPIWEISTSNLVYIRLHGHEQTHVSAYSRARFQAWARKVKRWTNERRDVHVYFDTDAFGHAPADALKLQALVSTHSDR
jgi:uncharacterized protein YecE (DUF72 family)